MDYLHKISKRAKNLSIKINSDGQVVVTSPRFVPKFLIKKFIKKSQDWINAQQQKRLKQKQHSSNSVNIFGKKYQKNIIHDLNKKFGIFINKQKLVVNLVNPNIPKKTVSHKINTFLKNTAAKYIIPRAHQLAKKMELDFNKITLREQTTRWGSCSSKKNLSFNWHLVHFNPEIIDYVIIHELSHLKHLNHSRQFWQFVKQYDPAYPKHRGFLKRRNCC